MKPSKLKFSSVLAFFFLLLGAAACNTSRGLGEDVEEAGEEIQETADEVSDG